MRVFSLLGRGVVNRPLLGNQKEDPLSPDCHNPTAGRRPDQGGGAELVIFWPTLDAFVLAALHSILILRSTISFFHSTSTIMKNDLSFSFASFQSSSLEHWLRHNFHFYPHGTGHPTFPGLTFTICKIRLLMNTYLQRI